ncbi:MAG: universal stress protein [Desulfococcaceae bacterium]
MKFQKPEIRRILLATDLSETANRAFGYAADMADAHEANITIVHVLEKLPPKAEWMAILLQELESVEDLQKKSESEILQRVKSYIEHYCTEFNGRFPACRLMVEAVIVEEGDPVKRILHHAHTGGYDVLVMGSRGYGFIREILTGGTSQSVVRQCRIPVFIVPPDEEK